MLDALFLTLDLRSFASRRDRAFTRSLRIFIVAPMGRDLIFLRELIELRFIQRNTFLRILQC